MLCNGDKFNSFTATRDKVLKFKGSEGVQLYITRSRSLELCQHLVTCFENGRISSFPATSVLIKKALMKNLTVHCKCRLGTLCLRTC